MAVGAEGQRREECTLCRGPRIRPGDPNMAPFWVDWELEQRIDPLIYTRGRYCFNVCAVWCVISVRLGFVSGKGELEAEDIQ